MAKNSLDQWSATPDDNSDIAGVNIAEGCPPSGINNAIRTVMAQIKAFLPIPANDAAGVNTVGGTAAAITITTNRPYTAYTSTLYLTFKAAAASTGATTVNVDTLGAKALKKITANGEVNIEAGNLVAGAFYALVYRASADGGNGAFILLNPTDTDLEQVGDGRYSLRNLGAKYLKRNGAIYNIADYPDLAALLPALPDSINWTSRATGQSNPLYAIAQDGDTKYRAVGNSGTLLSSPDRATWSAVSVGTTANLQFILKMPSFWLAAGTLTPTGGSVTVRSTDGDTWSVANLASGNYMTEVRGLGWTGTNALISGYDSTGAVINKVLYGIDGNSWTAVTVPTSGPIAANSSRAVMVSKWDNGGMVLTSDNQGVTWTTRVASGFGNVNDVCWDAVNSLFIAVFDGGVIKTSPDGITWTTRGSGTTANLLSVRAGPNGAIAAGSAQNFVLLSTNGTTWSSKAAPTTTGRALLADNTASYHFLSGNSTAINDGIRTLPTQFQVPDDGANQWIRALA